MMATRNNLLLLCDWSVTRFWEILNRKLWEYENDTFDFD